MQGAVPDIGHVTREQRPVVVQHLTGATRLGGPDLIAPVRIVSDTIGRIGHHKMRLHARM
jgi:hypothetical protein